MEDYTCPNWFQFHIGAIRRRLCRCGYGVPEVFQFHIGAIRSKAGEGRTRDWYAQFQFHIGAIRRDRCGI